MIARSYFLIAFPDFGSRLFDRGCEIGTDPRRYLIKRPDCLIMRPDDAARGRICSNRAWLGVT
jgi:hypothetical protein